MRAAAAVVVTLAACTTTIGPSPTAGDAPPPSTGELDAGSESPAPDALAPVMNDAGVAVAADASVWQTVDAAPIPLSPDASVPLPTYDAAVPPRMCSTPVSYGDWGAMDSALWLDGPNITVRDAPDAVTRLTLFMLPGQGAFTDGFATGSFPITQGIETCGACMYLVMYSADDGHFLAEYQSVGGTISITQMPTGGDQPLSFVATGIPFVATNGVDVGCTTYIDRVSFTGTAIAP